MSCRTYYDYISQRVKIQRDIIILQSIKRDLECKKQLDDIWEQKAKLIVIKEQELKDLDKEFNGYA